MRLFGAAAALAIVAVLSACAQTQTQTSSSPEQSATATPSRSPDPIAGMSLQQQVGQLFMVGSPATAAGKPALDALRERAIGGVFLSGRSTAGVAATASVVHRLTSASSSELPLFVATDQEGGQVQVLRGEGFSEIPSAVDQGRLAPAQLQADAKRWGGELRSAGVNLDLAPVADIVPSLHANNPPIADLDREYGTTAADVDAHAGAFVAGMTAAHVATTVKHFPGLGYVTGNTDVTAGVTDTVTSAGGPAVASFGTLIHGGAPLVMVSSAIYSRIDPSAPAVFSSAVVTGVLRSQLGFHGIVMSDDLSAATQVTSWTPADRAILAIEAGVDIVLVSRTPAVAAGMMDAVLAKSKSDPAFAAQVAAAARAVVAQKAALGIGG